MQVYHIDCVIKGYLPETPHEDGMLNEAVLEAFDHADFGELQDTDLIDFSDIWAVNGHYLFTVEADSTEDARSAAEDHVLELIENGSDKFGDLIEPSLESILVPEPVKRKEDKEPLR